MRDDDDAASLPTVPANAVADTVSVTGAAERPIVEDERSMSAFDAPATRFEEQGELGRGGMGRVADVFDRALARQVAVKSMLAREPAAISRFEREARITAQLEHPAIVPLYEAGRQPDGTPYYVMRRVDGKPLDQAVRGASLDQRLALVPNLLAVCDAAAFAHARSIVHRDIKPSNILLGRFGETLLIDWGLARRLDDREADAVAPSDGDLTRAGSIAGTPGFMSPEQARGDRVDTHTDVYALGATLFYALAGEAPHHAPSSTELITVVAAGRAPRWERLPDGVPEDLRAILAKALASDPAKRYPDAGALAADLRRFVTGNLVAAHRYSAGERLRRFVRRHRVAVTVGSIATAVLAAVVIVAVRRIASERDDANAARAAETLRADDVTLARARLLLDSNPTLAVAMVRPLANTERWREVSDVLAAASARGVAWRLPGSAETWRIGISPEGDHAFSVGGDGKVWLYDLRARTARVVFELRGPIDARHRPHVDWHDPTHLAALEGTTLAIVDTATAARHAIAIDAPAIATEEEAGVVCWVDAKHHAWRLAGDTPLQLAVGEDVEKVVPSRDGTQVAVLGATALWVVDAAGAVQKVLDERASAAAWDSTGAGLLVVARKSGRVQYVHLGDPPQWGPDSIGRNWPDKLVITTDHFAMQNINGVWTDLVRVPYQGLQPAGVTVARDGLIMAAASDGTIEVFDGADRSKLVAPTGRLDVITSRVTSHYLFGVGGPDLFVWDLDAVFPRRLAKGDSIVIGSRAGPHQLLVPDLRGPATWIDLQQRSKRPGPVVSGESPLIASPNGDRALTVFGDIMVMPVGGTSAELVERAARTARFLDNHRVVVLGNDGHVALHDLDARTTTALVASGARNLRVAADLIDVAYTDGSFERIELATGRRAKLHPPRIVLDQLTRAGRHFMSNGSALWCWERDGRFVPVPAAPHDITNLFADDERIVIDTDEAGFVLEPNGVVRRTIPLGTQRIAAEVFDGKATQSHDYFAVPRAAGGAMILDAATGGAWPVGQGVGTIAVGAPAITPDGTVLYALRDKTYSIWPLVIARSRAETIARADTLSNAIVDGDAITWR